MSTKSIFDVHVPLTRAALLRLMKGEHVENRHSPPGASMIEAVAKVRVPEEITEGERRAICDVLTRDVPQEYRGGYAVASWGDTTPVVGTTEWLTMIASNADRIAVQVQTGPNAWEPRWLAECTPEQQKSAMRTWLDSGTTPTWERVNESAAAWFSNPRPSDSKDVTDSALLTAFGTGLDHLAAMLGLTRLTRDQTEHLGRIVSSETDGSLRERCRAALKANETVKASSQSSPIGEPADLLRLPGETDAQLRERIRKVLDMKPPVPPPPPVFKAPVKTPTQEARERIGLVKWITEQSNKVGSPHHVEGREWEFIRSCEMRLNMGEQLSDKQTQWLRDIHATAMRKAATIAHLLPPTPKFT